MQEIASSLLHFMNLHLHSLKAIREDELIFKSSPDRWSKKEILGHLIDSAQNNIRRFIVAQYEDEPTIVYNQDKWVTIASYQQWYSFNLVDLLYLLNNQIVEILNNTSVEMAQRTCQAESVHTIEWLAADYLLHLKHHMHQVLNLEPVAYPH
jgi:hypothetical protein